MTERPLSPHLQVYRPQLTSVLSITHRATGVLLSAGAIWVIYWLYAVAQGPYEFAAAQMLAAGWIGRVLLLGLLFSTFFHLANGVRHLFWDAGWWLELAPAYRSGWAVVAVSVAATAYFGWLLSGGAA